MYYISELHMGGVDCDYKLMDSTDCWGPFKSLSKARKMFKEKVYKDKNLNHWDYMIRGPRRHNGHGHLTEWYNVKSKEYEKIYNILYNLNFIYDDRRNVC